jgi:hypothetical protein
MSHLKHKIIIHQVNGRIVHISASGETEIVLIESSPNRHIVSKLEPDFEFESGKAYEIYSDQDTSEFLKKHEI